MLDKKQYICLATNFRLQWEDAQQSYVLLFPEGMVQLNGPAAEILKLCPHSDKRDEEQLRIEDIISELESRFPDVPSLGDDVCEFVVIAQQKGWIELG